MFQSMLRALKSPVLILVHFFQKKPFCYLCSDQLWIKMFYYAHHKKFLNLNDPKTFNEKIQWLKLYDRKPEYRMMSDKYKVRQYIASKIGDEYLIPLLGVWDSVDDIDFESLPNQFVLKCNHDCGGIVICKDKNKLNINKAKKKLKKYLKRDFFWNGREDNYRGFAKKIIGEKFMTNGESEDLIDYKFICFGGEPKFIQVDSGRFGNHIRNYYDIYLNFINIQKGVKNDETYKVDISQNNLQKMLSIAEKLSEGLPIVRVDLYLIHNKIYFGELTFHPASGATPIQPDLYNYEWGSYINLGKNV